MSESGAPSESLTVTLTVELAGPSGKLHTKLPAPVVGVEGVGPDLAAVGAAVGGVEGEGVGTRIAGA